MGYEPTVQARSYAHQRASAAVRELRGRRGFTQENLGFEGGLHRNYVGAIERGEINPTLRVLLRLCRGLRVTLRELVDVYERQKAEQRSSQAA
jgi:transcriptional regulator with XRE-family HTH domain